MSDVFFAPGQIGAVTPPAPGAPSYAMTRSASSVNEGGSVNFNITSNRPLTSVVVNLTGIVLADLSAGTLSRTVDLDGAGAGFLTVALAADLTTEGPETLTATIAGTSPAVTASVTVNDTSLTPDGTLLTPLTFVTPTAKSTALRGGVAAVISAGKLDDLVTVTISPIGATPANSLATDAFTNAFIFGTTRLPAGTHQWTINQTHPTATNTGDVAQTLTITVANDATTVAEITTRTGGRAPFSSQAFFDTCAREAADPNNHPHMSGFTHNLIKSGKASDPTCWDTGTVPGMQAKVNIPNDYHFIYDLNPTVIPEFEPDATEASNPYIDHATGLLKPSAFGSLPAGAVIWRDVHVGGAAIWEWATTPTRLYVDTLMIHGATIGGQAHAPITGRHKCDVIFVAWELPGVTTRLGWMGMGPVYIHGERKAPRLEVRTNVANGATVISVPDITSASNWAVGDDVVLTAMTNGGVSNTDTQYTGPTGFWGPRGTQQINTSIPFSSWGFQASHDHQAKITAIDLGAKTVTISVATVRAHNVYSEAHDVTGLVETAYPYLVNMSRSIRFRSGYSLKRQTRAHTMQMHSDDQDIRFAEAFRMARTDTDPTMVVPAPPNGEWPVNGRPVLASSGGASITDANNVRGRYAFHSHVTGASIARKMTTFEGLTAWQNKTDLPGPGWGIVSHGGRNTMIGCSTFNWRGAGLVWENGNELGQCIDCTAMWNRSDAFFVDFFERAEVWENHNGHYGVGADMQARQIYVQGLVVTSSQVGLAYFQQAVNGLKRIPEEQGLRIRDPIAMGGAAGLTQSDYFDYYGQDNATYGVEQAQITHVEDLRFYGCQRGLFGGHRQHLDRTDMTPAFFRRMHAVNCTKAIHWLNYSFWYSFVDCLWVNDAKANTAAYIGNVTWGWTFGRMILKNWGQGYNDGGLRLNWGGGWFDHTWINVDDHFGPSEIQVTSENLSVYPWNGAYGPAVVTNEAVPNPGKTLIARDWTDWNSATDFPTAYPAAPLGPGGVRPSGLEAAPSPGAWIDPASDLVMDGAGSISIRGKVWDDMGVMFYPDWRSSEDMTTGFPSAALYRTAYNMNATQAVTRNGCFNDGGTWKTPMWVIHQDRKNMVYFPFRIDVTVAGLSSDFLLANTVNPAAVQPVTSAGLLPESCQPPRVYVRPTKVPVVTTPATKAQKEIHKLAIPLQCDIEHPKWTINAGLDADDFQIAPATAASVALLQWNGDGLKDYESPQDGDANNTYVVQVICTGPTGIASTPYTITVTVTDQNEAVTNPFTDNFNGRDEPLELSGNWDRKGGTGEGKLYARGNVLKMVNAEVGNIAYIGPKTGSTDMYVEGNSLHSFGEVALTAWAVDENNYVGLQTYAGVLYLQKRIGGALTTVATWTYAQNNAHVLRLEVKASDGTYLVKANGTTMGTGSLGPLPPTTDRGGFWTTGSAPGTPDVWDNFKSGAL